ncbi:MAG: phosphatidylserine decarboxylase [candidate division Zixibacteria bacterium]|nr:phosphatidylserine decarboxylase [candidate division Zixibacteria bacterium]MBU1471734.1 phosphatidylserine decarboxylase [candidate division Zixibacteria bacterium]MBU2625168.1 phosphatidylserine decarboxylase [candidate division Zixibacteria bacterium]
MTVAREGLPIIFAVMFAAAVMLGVGYVLSSYVLIIVGWAGVVLTAANFFFFREPQFEAVWSDGQILSPADGKVIVVDDQVPEGLSGLSQRVSIFLSIFDCHVNMIPTAGRIDRAVYRSGKKISAFRPRASEENQRSEIDLITSRGRIHFRQIVGSVARRVVFDLKAGQEVSAGQRFGVMRFGSRMDVFLPPDVNVLVKVGNRVKGGRSLIGEFRV